MKSTRRHSYFFIQYYFSLVVVFLTPFVSFSQDCGSNPNINGSVFFSNICLDDAAWSGSTYNGDIEIRIKGGKFYFDTDATINGDIILNGTGNPDVHFQSALTVTGSIDVEHNNYDFIVEQGAVLTVQQDVDKNSNNVNYTIEGELDVDGDILNGNNTDFYGDGIVRATNISNGNNNFQCYGSGNDVNTCDIQFDVSGNCTPSSDFCNDVSNNALPIVLHSLRAKYSNDILFIDWSTLAEFNCDYYELSISHDGELFFALDYPICENLMQGAEYTYQYSELFVEPKYLMFEQYDFDGSVHETRIIPIESSAQENTDKIFPNPTSDGFFTLLVDNIVDFEVYSTSGQLANAKLSKEGDSRYSLFIPAPGAYVLSLLTDVEKRTYTLIVKP